MPKETFSYRWVSSAPRSTCGIIEPIDEPVITAPNFNRTGSGKIKMAKSSSVGIELNLLGKTSDEAISELDKYLDDAYIAHLPSVRIVHGKGTVSSGKPYTTISAAARSWMSTIWASLARETQALPS